MSQTTATRRPTAKQREWLLAALDADNLSRHLDGLQQRTVEAMRADGWIEVFRHDGAELPTTHEIKRGELVGAVGRITEQGAAAINKRIEWHTARDAAANGRAVVEQVARVFDVPVELVEQPTPAAKVREQHARGLLTDGELHAELILLGVEDAPAEQPAETAGNGRCLNYAPHGRHPFRANVAVWPEAWRFETIECEGVESDGEVDPRPGTINDLLLMVRVYGDDRANLARAVDAGKVEDRATYEQRAVEHFEYIAEQLRKHYVEPAAKREEPADVEVDALVQETLDDVDAVEQNARMVGDEPGESPDTEHDNAVVAAHLDRLAAEREQAIRQAEHEREQETDEQLVADDEFVFTFGSAHEHPATGESLGNCYVVVEASDRVAAYSMMFDRFGDEFAFGYDPDSARSMLAEYPEMHEVELPPVLPAVELHRSERNDVVKYRGRDGVILFTFDSKAASLSTSLPGLTHSHDASESVAHADGRVKYLMQKWVRSTLGMRVSVELVD